MEGRPRSCASVWEPQQVWQTLSATRVLASATVARRAAPFVVFAPAALWIATSADAFFAGFAAIGVCLLVHAASRRGMDSDAIAAAGGLVLGLSLFLSYGLALIGILAVAVVLVQRTYPSPDRWRDRGCGPVFRRVCRRIQLV